MRTHDVQIWSATQQSTQDTIVEIFVCGKAKHILGGTLTLPGKKARADTFGLKTLLIHPTHFLSLRCALAQICFYF